MQKSVSNDNLENILCLIFQPEEIILPAVHFMHFFTGPNIKGLALEKIGGRGDGYIIPPRIRLDFLVTSLYPIHSNF